MRTGPKPLMAHLGLMLSARAHSGNLEDSGDELTQMLRGIRRYQMHDYTRPDETASVVWRSGSARLFHYKATVESNGVPIFIVPSMINRYCIMDLHPQQSFCGWLNAQGHDVFLLDWGEPADDDPAFDVDAIFEQRLFPAVGAAAEQCGSRLGILGYCMGGVFSVALAQLKPDLCAGLCLLATPWDFQAQDGDLQKWVEFWSPVGLSMIMQSGRLSHDWIQTVFASLDPFQMTQKFSAFSEMEEDARAEVFVAVEDWLNDTVDLPGALARVCIQDWFLHNKPMRGSWFVCGEAVKPEMIACPVLNVASTADRLVPYSSSVAVHKDIVAAEHLRAACGHIGFMASERSPAAIWKPISDFFCRGAV